MSFYIILDPHELSSARARPYSSNLQVDCVEAIYNLGLVNMHLGLANDSLQAFQKLHTIIPNNTEVIYHIANLYEVTGSQLGFSLLSELRVAEVVV